MGEIESPDCGDNSCLYAMPHQKTGMRTNGGCRCDRAGGMQVHSQDEKTSSGWYYTKKAMWLGRLGMLARDARIAELEAEIASLKSALAMVREEAFMSEDDTARLMELEAAEVERFQAEVDEERRQVTARTAGKEAT